MYLIFNFDKNAKNTKLIVEAETKCKEKYLNSFSFEGLRNDHMNGSKE